MNATTALPFQLDLGEHYRLPGRLFPLQQQIIATALHRDGDLNHYQQCKAQLRSAQPGRCDLSHPHFDRGGRERVLAWLQQERRRVGYGEVPTPLDGHFAPDASPAPGTLTMDIQEDLVIVMRPKDAAARDARVVYADVSFPSGWAPETILGNDFEQLHAKVPGHDRFTKAHDPNPHGRGGHRSTLARILFPKQSLARFLWTLTPDETLDRHPYTPCVPLKSWSETATAFLRVERQVIVPLDSTLSAFLIRVYVIACPELPLPMRVALGAALVSMPHPIADYKGLHECRDRIASLVAGSRL